MKIVYRGIIQVHLDPEKAIKLLKSISGNTDFDSIDFDSLKKQLVDELKPQYEYTIKCRDCSARYTYTSNRKLSEEDVSRGGICGGCSDDYK